MNTIKKVYQNSFGEKGTCYTACLASILSIDFEEVPRFVDLTEHLKDDMEKRTELWHELTTQFLNSKNVTMNIYEDENISAYHEWSTEIDEDNYYIVIGNSPRSNARNHAVIYKNGEPYHDPNPEGTFLVNNVQIQEINFK